MPNGTVSRFSNQERSIAPTCNIAIPLDSRTAPSTPAVFAPTIIFETAAIVNGTTAPAATSPVALFSIVSSTSSGFFMPGGTAAPSASFAAHSPTISNAGPKNAHWANHGKAAFCSGVDALKY